jgi:hypothetical protein
MWIAWRGRYRQARLKVRVEKVWTVVVDRVFRDPSLRSG